MAVPPGSSGQSAYRFQPELLALAKYPNGAVKATGQPGYAEDAYPFRSFHQHLHRRFDAFGTDRMFWGTDITRMPCPWRQCVTVFTEELPWLQGRDLELVMGEALCNWVGWPLPGWARLTRGHTYINLYIICHMGGSVAGLIPGSGWRPAENRAAGLFERLHEE